MTDHFPPRGFSSVLQPFIRGSKFAHRRELEVKTPNPTKKPSFCRCWPGAPELRPLHEPLTAAGLCYTAGSPLQPAVDSPGGRDEMVVTYPSPAPSLASRRLRGCSRARARARARGASALTERPCRASYTRSSQISVREFACN